MFVLQNVLELGNQVIAQFLGGANLSEFPGGVVFGIVVTPAVIFVLGDFYIFQLCHFGVPGFQHSLKLNAVTATLYWIDPQMHLPLTFADLQTITVLQGKEGVHQPNFRINVRHILSAVMHADERNRAMSEKLGEDVYHYHL